MTKAQRKAHEKAIDAACIAHRDACSAGDRELAKLLAGVIARHCIQLNKGI